MVGVVKNFSKRKYNNSVNNIFFNWMILDIEAAIGQDKAHIVFDDKRNKIIN